MNESMSPGDSRAYRRRTGAIDAQARATERHAKAAERQPAAVEELVGIVKGLEERLAAVERDHEGSKTCQ